MSDAQNTVVENSILLISDKIKNHTAKTELKVKIAAITSQRKEMILTDEEKTILAEYKKKSGVKCIGSPIINELLQRKEKDKVLLQTKKELMSQINTALRKPTRKELIFFESYNNLIAKQNRIDIKKSTIDINDPKYITGITLLPD